MPPKNRGHGGSGGPRPHGAASIREGHDEVAQIALTGRAGGTGGRSAPGSHGPPTDDLVTHRTGDRGGVPDGSPTAVGPIQDAEVKRSLEMENSAATLMADRGYRVKQNPTPDEVALARQQTGDTGDPRSNPDYLIEGRVFDCYSPTKPQKPVRGVAFEAGKKVERGQTQRVVVNLEDWRGDLAALQRQFDDWPIEDLKEVKVITPDGIIVQMIPKQENG